MAYPDIPMAELIVARDQQGAVGTKNITGRSLDFAYELENHQTSLRRSNTCRLKLSAEKSVES